MMDKLHNAALAVIDKLLAIHGASQEGTCHVEDADFIPHDHPFPDHHPQVRLTAPGDVGHSYFCAPQTNEQGRADAQAIATDHNSQLALLTIARVQLVEHHTVWWDFCGYNLDAENTQDIGCEDIEIIDYRAKEHRKICTTLASIKDEGAADELAALREALEEPREQS